MKLHGIVPLPKETIDRIFEEATNQWQIIGLYREVIPDWDRVESLEGWPGVNEGTSDYLYLKAIEFDKEHHPDVLAGGLWMNRGFGVSATVGDWEVDLSECVVTYKEDE